MDSKHLKTVYLLIWSVFLIGGLEAQSPKYLEMRDVLSEIDELLEKREVSRKNLYDAEQRMEKVLIQNANETFVGKDTLIYYYQWRLKDISIMLGDIENYIRYLQNIKKSPFRDIMADELEIDRTIAKINKYYGDLRVRFTGEALREMAVLKSISAGDTSVVTVHFLPPREAWPRDSEQERDQKLQRLEFLQEQIEAGEFPLFFDSYDQQDGFFYFELPYVPYLRRTKNPDAMYAITFDRKKRYRIDFYKAGMLLEIQPEENWFLESRIPGKWVKLTFSNELRVRFRDTKSEGWLHAEEFIQITRETDTEFYVPGDRSLEITIQERRRSFHTYISKFAYFAAAVASLFLITSG